MTETWVLIVFLMVGNAMGGSRSVSSVSVEFGTLEACKAAEQAIRSADGVNVNIVSSGCHKSGFTRGAKS